MPDDLVIARAAHAVTHARDFARVFAAYTEALVMEGVPQSQAREVAGQAAYSVVLSCLPEEEWDL